MSQTKAQLISDLVQALAFTATASAPTNGMFLSASNTLAISTNSAQRLTVDSSGNVGIGTTSPSNLLHVNGQARFEDFLRGHSTQNKLYIADDIALSATKKLYLDGGSNTYIHETSADNIAVVTSGSEGLRIDSSGRLLVGTTSGSAAFAGDANNLVIVESGNTAKIVVHRKTEDVYGGILRLGKTRSSTSAIDNNDEVGVIEFFGHDSTDTNSRLAYIGCYAEADGANNDVPGRLVLATTADGASSPTERMRIDSSGNVGIGTTSPAGGLHVDAASGVDGPIFDSGGTANTNHALLVRDSGNNQLLRVNNNGNVGIGTTSPAGTLGVDGAAFFGNQSSSGSTDGVLRIVESTSSIYLQTGTNTSTGSSAALVFSNINASNEWMRIDSSGRVGIGTSSPDTNSKAHIFDSSLSRQLLVQGDANDAAITVNKSGQSFTFGVDASDSNKFKINTGNTVGAADHITIDTSGNVGIGVTSPEASLHISDTDHGIAAGYVGGTLPDVAGIYTSSSTSHGQAYGSLIVQARAEYSGYGIVFRASNNERARIDSSGRLLVGTTAGTSSGGGGAVQTGGGGTMVTNSSSVANNGTLDITVGTSNICYWSGFLFVNNINGANGNTRTQSTYSVFGTNQAAAATFSQIATTNGTNGASSFTVTYVDNGIIRFTNTSGATCNVAIGFFGGGINMT